MSKREKRRVRYTLKLLNQIRQYNRPDKRHGGERCALIMKVSLGAHLRMFEMPNVHKDPENHFAIARSDAQPLLDIYGLHSVFHTHIKKEDNEPSEDDIEMIANLRMIYPQVLGIVYVVPLGLLIEYSGDGVMRRRLIADLRSRAS